MTRPVRAPVAVCAVMLVVLAACKLDHEKAAPGQLSMNDIAKRDAGERKKSADREAALLAEARTMSVEQAEAKIAALKADPQDLSAYYQLMRYYEFRSDPKGKDALILWYIEHEPDGKARPWNINPAWDRAGYERGKKLWLKHVRQRGASADIYDRAAAFLEGDDKPLAEEILIDGRKAYPNDKRWASSLGMHYAQVLLGAAEPRTEYNVFRTVSTNEAHSFYATGVRAKLAASDDAPMLAQTAQWLMGWGRGPRGDGLDFDLVELARGYADRAFALQPNSHLAQSMKSRAEQLKNTRRLQELAKLPRVERARLSDADRMMLALREMEMAWSQGKTEDAIANAGEVLDLAARTASDPQCGEAIYEANITLGKAALRNGDKRKLVRYLLASADTPGSEQLLRGDGFSFGVMDMNLMRALVDWGERNAVAQFLERMGPKTNRTKEFLDWAAQIRKGINPDMRPTRSGCGKDLC